MKLIAYCTIISGATFAYLCYASIDIAGQMSKETTKSEYNETIMDKGDPSMLIASPVVIFAILTGLMFAVFTLIWIREIRNYRNDGKLV